MCTCTVTSCSKYDITNYNCSLRNDTCFETMTYLNDALDTFIGSKVALVCMRYFQWCTTIFEVKTTIITLKIAFFL